MSTEQIIAVIGTIIGAPLLIKIVEKWFEAKNLTLQSVDKKTSTRDEREWEALITALDRERKVYQEILAFERQQWATRLAEIEVRLGRIQEDYLAAQRSYWEERVMRERLQARVDSLEHDLGKVKTNE